MARNDVQTRPRDRRPAITAGDHRVTRYAVRNTATGRYVLAAHRGAIVWTDDPDSAHTWAFMTSATIAGLAAEACALPIDSFTVEPVWRPAYQEDHYDD